MSESEGREIVAAMAYLPDMSRFDKGHEHHNDQGPRHPVPPEIVRMFADHVHLRAVIDSGLEGRLGRVRVTEAGDAACLDLGCYSFFGGDAESTKVGALIDGVTTSRELIYPSPDWRHRLLQAISAERLTDRPMRRFDGRSLNRESLRQCVKNIGADAEVRRLDVADAAQLDAGIAPHALQTYVDPEHFVAEGLGWGAFIGERLVSAATSYAMSTRQIEVAIATRAEHRGSGLASATAAALLIDAMDRGIEPCWNAANPVSQRMAIRLGFTRADTCEVLFLE